MAVRRLEVIVTKIIREHFGDYPIAVDIKSITLTLAVYKINETTFDMLVGELKKNISFFEKQGEIKSGLISLLLIALEARLLIPEHHWRNGADPQALTKKYQQLLKKTTNLV